MKKKWSWKKITAVGASMALALSLSFGLVFSNISLNGAGDNAAADNNTTNSVEGGGTDKVVSNYAATITYPNGAADLGRFPEGYAYTFTDKTKVDNYRARKIKSDLTTVRVVPTAEAGSQQNPYVIATTTDWENFVRKMGTAANNYGSGKYFVLAEDLNFKGATFHHVDEFRGTFCGMGHSLSNITVSNWQYFNGSSYASLANTHHGYGVFGYIYDATITDLIVTNYSFSNMPVTANLTDGSEPGGRVCRSGGVVGRSSGTDFVLNCHTSGSISSSVTYSTYNGHGGIVGFRQDVTNKTLIIYRCGAEFTVSTGGFCIPGGILGEAIDATTAKVYDCAANLINNSDYTSRLPFGGVGIGYTWAANIVAENIVGTVTIKSDSPIYSSGIIGLGGPASAHFKNLYGAATAGGKPVWAVMSTTAFPNNSSAYSVENVHTVKTSADYPASGNKYVDALSNFSSQVHNYTTLALLTAETKKAVGDSASSPLYSGIWDVSKIGGKYDPDNSPVRNYFSNTLINFAKDADDETLIQLDGSENPALFPTTEVGVPLPKPADKTPAGKSFVAWSLDKTSDANPLTDYPESLYGTVTMYPIWNMTNVDVAITAKLKDPDNGTDVTINAAAGTVKAKYIGETAVTLTASVTNAPCAAEEYDVSWTWYKNGVLIPDETESTLDITDVSTVDTGDTYQAKAILTHKTLLWRTDAKSPEESNSYTVQIAKGTLTPSGGITLIEKTGEEGSEKPVIAYWGQPLSELLPYVETDKMQNSHGTAVAGTVAWKVPADTVKDSQQTYKATFTATGDDASSYESAEIDVTISPTVLQLVYSFVINEQMAPQTFAVPKQYGTAGNTAGSVMASEFENAYLAWLDEMEVVSGQAIYNAMIGKTPCFNSRSINEYRTDSSVYAYFDAEHVADDAYIVKTPVTDPESGKTTGYTATRTITVTFADTKYAVKLYNDHTGGNSLTTTSYSLGYGEKITKSGAKTYTDGKSKTQFLTGWFVSASADGDAPDYSGNRNSWGFDTDRVTNDTYLSAGWMEGFLELAEIVSAEVNGKDKTFTARETPKSSDYIVTGRYVVYNSADKNTIVDSNQLLLLSPDDYTVTADGTVYHTTGSYPEAPNMNDRVTITAKANTQLTKPVYVKVNKKAVDMSGVYFPNQSVEYDGTVKKVGAVDLGFLTAQGVSANDYLKVNYEYRNSSNGHENDNEGVTELGTYYVYFTIVWKENTDFVSGSVSATFTITAPKEEVYVEWSYAGGTLNSETGIVEYTFNNTVQHPIATIRKVSDDSEVMIQVAYTGNDEQKDANVGNTVSSVVVSLLNANYRFADDDTTKQIRFIIKKASIKKPTLSANQFEYSGQPYDIFDHIAIEGYTKDEFKNFISVTDGVETNVKRVSGSNNDPYYHSTVALIGGVNIEWEDHTTAPVTLDWLIYKKAIPVPTFTETLVYSGRPYKLSEHLNNYDATLMTLRGETGEATLISGAGSYRATVSLIDGNNYEWQQADFDESIRWTIDKAELFLTWSSWNHKFTGGQIYPSAKVDVSSLVDADKTTLANVQLSYRGDEYAIEPGVYETTAVIAGTLLNDNYTLHPSTASLSWVVRESDDEVILTIIWSYPSNGVYTFTGEIQRPEIAYIINENTGEREEVSEFYITYSEDYHTSRYNGNYTASVEEISSPFYENVTLRVRQAKVSYQIRGTGGNTPTTPTPTPGGDGDGEGEGNNPVTGTIAVIPQLIVSGVAVILILVFTIMTLNYASVAKNAKNKVKKLAQMSYSFAPFGLLAFGLTAESAGAWWGIAGGLMGFALLMAIMMFVYRGKSKKALAMLEEEQLRIEEEKEAAREAQQEARDAQMREEQMRRDNEFKMMFAALQQNYQQPQVGYDDMQNMITSAVTALLPGLQQSMQALPPAQSEADDLRAQMAQQQELINQLMQERNANYSAPAKSYDESDQAAEAAFARTSDEQFTLEELYGRMTDEAKRLYYEIGGYIMNKPNTSQNDGKYAVLFKYRGRTLFKLCIKGDAPILYYMLENNVQGEVLITNAAALEDAKDIVDMRMKRIDRELDN